MAKSPTPAEPEKLSRLQQFAQTYQMAKQQRPRPSACWVLGAFLLVGIVGFGVFWLSSADSNVARPGDVDRRRRCCSACSPR